MSLDLWRNIAIVWLAIPVILVLFVPPVLLFFIIRGMLWVLKQIRKYAPLVQMRFRQVSQITDTVSQKVAAPFISGSAAMARLRQWRAAAISSSSTKEV